MCLKSASVGAGRFLFESFLFKYDLIISFDSDSAFIVRSLFEYSQLYRRVSEDGDGERDLSIKIDKLSPPIPLVVVVRKLAGVSRLLLVSC